MSRAVTAYYLPAFLSAAADRQHCHWTCISMYNYLLISWLAHHAKKVSRNVSQRHFFSASFRPEKKQQLIQPAGNLHTLHLFRLAKVEVWLISLLHLVLRRKRKRANHASLILERWTLIALAITERRAGHMCMRGDLTLKMLGATISTIHHRSERGKNIM